MKKLIDTIAGRVLTVSGFVTSIVILLIIGFLFTEAVGLFSNPVVVVLYLVWFVALWFHLTHGFWSALHTLGWNNNIWFNRWKVIANVYATIVCLGFAVVAIAFYFKSL